MVDDRARLDRRAIEAWASAETARRTVRALAEATTGLGIELLAIKGAHLAWCVAPSPTYRTMRDADVVVITGSFAQVVHRLEQVPEFEIVMRDWSTHSIRYRPVRGGLDLHRLPLMPAWGRMRRRALRRHAQSAEQLGPGVLVPDLPDAAVMAIAHFVKDGFGSIETTQAPTDLDVLVAAGLTPAVLRERLILHRLRRVGLVGMTKLAAEDARWAPFRDALTLHPWEPALAVHFVQAIERAARRDAYAGLMVVRAIGDDLVGTSTSLAWGVARGVRDRFRQWRR